MLGDNIPSPKTHKFNVQISWNWIDETDEQNSLALESFMSVWNPSFSWSKK